MPKKNSFLLLLCASILSTGVFICAQNTEQKVFKWKCVSVWPQNIPIFNDGIKKFTDDIRIISRGQLDIKFYPALENIDDINKSIGPKGIFDAVSQGTVEMGFGSPIYWADNVKGCEFMYAVPFGLSSVGMNAWIYRGGGIELWEDLFGSYNIKPFPMGNTGGAMGGWFRNEIKTIDDFKGLKIRMSGFCSKVYEKIGAIKKWMIADEAFSAFEKGEIDAIVCQGPYHDQLHKFHKICKNYYYPGWQEPGGVLSLIINKKAWDSLPPHLQEMIQIVRGSLDYHIYNSFISNDAIALQQLKQQNVKIMRFPQEVLDRLRKLSEEVLEEEAQKDPQFKRVYEAFKVFKEHNKEYEWIEILNDAVSPPKQR